MKEQLDILIESCPWDSVRIELASLIASNEIVLNFRFDWGPNNGYAAITFPALADEPITLWVNPAKLIKIKDGKAGYHLLLILHHEYIHYLQWISEDEEPVESCAQTWHREYEAYYSECQLARKWGLSNLHHQSICPYAYSEDAFSWALFKSLPDALPKYANCTNQWASLNGFPVP
ncbi:MAG: hypothetical protein ABIG32_02220 [Candidatus Uhrbacteria bacterium]|nr:hypothetical protein [Patescibacteria group bacterium]